MPAGAPSPTVIDPNGRCDALVPQADNLPPICVRKYANVSIAGWVQLMANVGSPPPPALTIVASNAFAVESTAVIEACGYDSD